MNIDPRPAELIAFDRQDQGRKPINDLTEEQWSRYQKYVSETNNLRDHDALRKVLLEEAPIGKDAVWGQVAFPHLTH